MSTKAATECRASPGGCGNIFCPRCRTERAFGKLDRRAISSLGGRARSGAWTTEASRNLRAARLAAMSPEEKRLAMAKVQAGRIMKRVARWPFPDGPVLSRAESLRKAWAGAATKRARTKLAREKREAERMTDILARRARGETLQAIGDVHDITATHVLRLIKQRARKAPQRREPPAAPSRR